MRNHTGFFALFLLVSSAALAQRAPANLPSKPDHQFGMSSDPLNTHMPGAPAHGAGVPIGRESVMNGNGPTAVLAPKTIKPGAHAAGDPITIPPATLLSHSKSTPPPVYPANAIQSREDGTVLIALEVGLDGTVTQTVPLNGKPALTSVAEATVKQWTFEPFKIKGDPKVVRSLVQFDFRWRGDGTRPAPQVSAPTIAPQAR